MGHTDKKEKERLTDEAPIFCFVCKPFHFKGYHNEVTEYVKEGTFKYKYCIGNFADRKATQRELTVIRKDFPNAFVTEM